MSEGCRDRRAATAAGVDLHPTIRRVRARLIRFFRKPHMTAHAMNRQDIGVMMKWFLVFVVPAASAWAGEPDTIDIPVSEWCPVFLQLPRGAPLTYEMEGRTLRYFDTAFAGRCADKGVYNVKWNHEKGRVANPAAGLLISSLWSDAKPVVDVTPESPNPGDALNCAIVIKAELLQGRIDIEADYRDRCALAEAYTFTWKVADGQALKDYEGLALFDKKREDSIWREVARGATLPAGITKEGEVWACYVVPSEHSRNQSRRLRQSGLHHSRG
jgi:hypothetical protein